MLHLYAPPSSRGSLTRWWLQSMEIPVVELVVHPDLAQAAALLGSSSTARIDLDALGLSHRVRT